MNIDEHYDIFISFKNLDENGNDTEDKEIAYRLYRYLSAKKLKVFYSPETLKILGSDDWGETIQRAISLSKVFIAIGTSRKYLESQWLQKERTSFLALRYLDRTRVIYSYIGSSMTTGSLPEDLKNIESFNDNKEGELDRLYAYVSNHFFNLAITPSITKVKLSDSKIENDTSLQVDLFDNIIRNRSDKLFRKIQFIRKEVVPELKLIPLTEYSHDSESHAKQTLIFIAELFYDGLNKLSDRELFILAIFTLIHDIGMRAREGFSPKRLYQSHHIYSKDYAYELNKKGFLNNEDTEIIASLCLLHKEQVSRAKIHFDKIQTDVRIEIIFSMFKIADMLDVETQPGEILRIKPELLHQTIGGLDIDSVNNILTIWKGIDVSNKVFEAWYSFFENRLNDLNIELAEIGYSYKLCVK